MSFSPGKITAEALRRFQARRVSVETPVSLGDDRDVLSRSDEMVRRLVDGLLLLGAIGFREAFIRGKADFHADAQALRVDSGIEPQQLLGGCVVFFGDQPKRITLPHDVQVRRGGETSFFHDGVPSGRYRRFNWFWQENFGAPPEVFGGGDGSSVQAACPAGFRIAGRSRRKYRPVECGSSRGKFDKALPASPASGSVLSPLHPEEKGDIHCLAA